MKRAFLNHPKTFAAARLLGVTRAALIGHMALLYDWTGEYATDGVIGRFTDEEIARGADFPVDKATDFVAALIEVRFVDKISKKDGRLQIHDWFDHCEQFVLKRLERKGVKAPPRRENIQTSSGRHPDNVHPAQAQAQASAQPTPTPTPTPSPAQAKLEGGSGSLSGSEGNGIRVGQGGLPDGWKETLEQFASTGGDEDPLIRAPASKRMLQAVGINPEVCGKLSFHAWVTPTSILAEWLDIRTDEKVRDVARVLVTRLTDRRNLKAEHSAVRRALAANGVDTTWMKSPFRTPANGRA